MRMFWKQAEETTSLQISPEGDAKGNLSQDFHWRGNKAREEPGPPAEKLSRNGRWGAEEPTMPNRTHPSATAVPKATEQDSFKCYCCPFHYKPCQKGDWWNLNKTKQAEPHAKPYSPHTDQN